MIAGARGRREQITGRPPWPPREPDSAYWRNAPLGDALQASEVTGWVVEQQLVAIPVKPPTTPPLSVHLVAVEATLHFVLAFFVMQQVTAPGLPQFECAAHFFTRPLQFLGSWLLLARVFATPAAHLTNVP
jgi:hypothetical protein